MTTWSLFWKVGGQVETKARLNPGRHWWKHLKRNAVPYILYTFQIVSIHVGANCFNGAKAITARGIPTWTKCGKHTECQDESDGFLGVQSSNPKEKHNGQGWLCKTIMTRYDKIWHDTTRYDKIWQDMTRYDKIWQDMSTYYIHVHPTLPVPLGTK